MKGNNFALVRSSGLDDIVLSCHRTKASAERAMRAKGGEPNSLLTNGLFIADVSVNGSWELIEVCEKLTVRPR